MDLKVSVLLIVTYCCRIAEISGQCIIQLPEDPALRPTFFKTIGSRTAMISNEKQYIELYETEEMSTHCHTRFIKPDFIKNQGMADLRCTGNEINRQYNRMDFICDSLKWNLYESAPFKWCPPKTISYILARPKSGGFDYLAGICYNFAEMTMVSLHYAVAPKFSKYMYPNRLNIYTPSVEVNDIAISFIPRNISLSMYDNPQFNEWMQFANYQNHSMIQNRDLYNDSYDKFGGLLEFAWWPSLRLGNWRRYEEALSQHIELDAHEYDVLAGISGSVSAPIYKETCQQNLTLVELADKTNRKLPLYVWHYLKSTKSEKDNLVVIGVNSPFYEFYNETDLVFCTDICPQVPWLQKVHATFHYQTMGIIFCCSVDDVRASKRLNGFPIPSKTVTPLPPPLSILHSKTSFDEFDEPIQTEDEGKTNKKVLSNIDDY